MKGIFILLGSNLGNRSENFQKAIELLEAKHIPTISTSSIYETEPWGNPNQDWFLNMVIEVDTVLTPKELLNVCLDTEVQMGRERIEKWGARIIDIDILYFNDEKIDTDNLRIPHPGIAMRRFTLLPLCDLIPSESHPILSLTQKEMLAVCPDELECRKVSTNLNL
ncbi:2-amino-4-hydroxy-6-hydroxymethyldihydropteridine diphosphokinase [Marinoscillum sp. MHG1-6]|uniref:2-amino-4-hydroxy-6- hydroxymethyldihydropteridine diphosphokinase n=1 Tax=Marinoscillum sp. MHG1-6 TaxID=2959627 RepID=UPI0021582350|nr:2-amino-4-hydroxy-6-hydroxymethyldihydropteridine diphosphokinase [Marinoscillum sp. MHG1-6]